MAITDFQASSPGSVGIDPDKLEAVFSRAEKEVRVPGYPNALNLTQSWWCGYGPYEHPTIVVCALIENGGHGGTSAAPAALKVFEQFFGKKGLLTNHISD